MKNVEVYAEYYNATGESLSRIKYNYFEVHSSVLKDVDFCRNLTDFIKTKYLFVISEQHEWAYFTGGTLSATSHFTLDLRDQYALLLIICSKGVFRLFPRYQNYQELYELLEDLDLDWTL